MFWQEIRPNILEKNNIRSQRDVKLRRAASQGTTAQCIIRPQRRLRPPSRQRSCYVAVGLRLGCALCEAHACQCGVTVDTLGTHAFSCKRSSSRIQRHNYINVIIWRSLTRAGVPSMKEPHSLVRDDGKRPDGLTLLSWNSGRSATWDVTVVDTLRYTYLQHR